jgi:hypothetical protein
MVMASPYGGDRGGGKPKRKAGAPKGNTNARGSVFLPPAKNTEERRNFLNALEAAGNSSISEKSQMLVNLAFARVASFAEDVGVTKLLRAVQVIDTHRKTNHRINGDELALRRELLKDSTIAEVWKIVGECEHCGESVDQILRGLEMGLLQMGGCGDGVDESKDG